MKLFSLFMAAAILGSCVTDTRPAKASDSLTNKIKPNDGDAQIQDSLAGRWMLIPALPSDTATGKIPWLTFNLTNMKLSGNTGCNNFSVSFAKSGNNINIDSNFMSTKMACPGYDENSFVKSLMNTNNFKIYGDTLELRTDMTPLSYWVKGSR